MSINCYSKIPESSRFYGLIETLRNLPGVEEIKTEIVLDRIKEDHSISSPRNKIFSLFVR